MKHNLNFKDQVSEKCLTLGPEFEITQDVAARLAMYASQLEKWQKAINLISNKTLPDMWERHFLDSLQLIHHIPKQAKLIVDMGSGAGFPGLVLAMFDRWDVHLVESDTRKAVFLRDTARICGVKTTVHAKRLETIDHLSADVITARALAPLSDLFKLSTNFRQKSTKYIFLKGQNADDELTAASKNWKMQVVKTPSITDPLGVILNIDEVSPNGC